MHTPFFTIGLTTYNRSALLKEAIQSVLSQGFTDYELLIVDDHSPDDTTAIVNAFAAPQIRYVRQPTNLGIGPARNAVISQAQGEFIIFLDDDDRLMPDFLEHAHRALRNAPATVGFAVSGRRTLRAAEEGDVVISEETFGCDVATFKTGNDYLAQPIGGGSGLIVRTSAARSMPAFSSERHIGEDSTYILSLAKNWDYAIVPQSVLVVYALQTPQLTQNFIRVAMTSEHNADLEHLVAFPATRTRYYRLAGRMFYAAKQRASGRRCMWKAIRAEPLAYKTWGLFFLLELSPVLPLTMRQRLLSHHRHGYRPA